MNTFNTSTSFRSEIQNEVEIIGNILIVSKVSSSIADR